MKIKNVEELEEAATSSEERLNIANYHLIYLHDLRKIVSGAYALARGSVRYSTDNPYEMDVQIILDQGAVRAYATTLDVFIGAMLSSADFSQYIEELTAYVKQLGQLQDRILTGGALGFKDFDKIREIDIKTQNVLSKVGSFSSRLSVPLKKKAQRGGTV